MSDDLFSQPPPKKASTKKLREESRGAESGGEAAGPIPASVDYVPESGGRWRIERFEALAAELPVLELAGRSASTDPAERCRTAARLFHELVTHGNPRWWTRVRRLYGMAPLVPDETTDLDDLRVWERAELCAALGIEPKQLQADLDMLRGLMRATLARENGEAGARPAETAVKTFDADGEGRLVLDDELLRRYGYNEAMFNIRQRVETIEKNDDGETERRIAWVDRSPEQNRAEREWFVAELRRWQRVLDETMTAGFARNALFNQLQIRRLETEMVNLSPTANNYDDLAKRRAQMEKSYTDQLTAIEERFPEFASTAQKLGFRACFHDLVKAYLDYKNRGDTRLMDRVRTALEIEVDFRQHTLAEEPRYRLGQTVFIAEAIAGLWDPNWQSQLKPGLLAKLDRGMKQGIELARQERGETLVDLEVEGEAGEYPPLVEGVGKAAGS